MARQKYSERRFSQQAKLAGFRVNESPSIRVNEPVKDKRGNMCKRITNPDFYIIDPLNLLKYYIEVTDGSGNTPHKKAQQRVVDAAGVTNYKVITGNDIRALEACLTNEARYILLASFLKSISSTLGLTN